jgi:DtxR family Mn-dependent transcriptional regulator
MTLSDRAEEILEALWIELLEHKKETVDASILKDNEGLKELLDTGHVEVKNNRLTFTSKGKEEAKNCVRRHRLAERLLTDVLDVKRKLLHETGCKFEHLLHKGLDDNICTLLGHPKTCPHGEPIPEGACCRLARKRPEKLIMPLTELEPNRKAQIAYLQTQDHVKLQKLIAMSTLPKTEVVLTQKFPSYVFKIGKSQFAIDKELASSIYVRII